MNIMVLPCGGSAGGSPFKIEHAALVHLQLWRWRPSSVKTDGGQELSEQILENFTSSSGGDAAPSFGAPDVSIRRASMGGAA
jgi:hypothetical protein